MATSLGLILLGVIAPMFIRPSVVLRRVLDEKGQQVYRADGKPKFENDPIGQFKLNWDAYAIMSVGGVCVLFGVGSGLRKFIRQHQAPKKDEEA